VYTQGHPLRGLVLGHTLFVPENVGFGREEDLAPPKGEGGQPKEHDPDTAHHDGHDGVQDEEAWDLKGVAEDAQTRDPAHVWKRQGPASKDLAKVLVDFEPVRQEAEGEEKYGKAKEENSDEHARGEPDLAGQRRDEVVLRKDFACMRSEIDQREGSKAGRATSDECAVRLVTFHKPSRHNSKNIYADIEHCHEEANALEKVTDKEHADRAKIGGIQDAKDICRNDADKHHRENQESPRWRKRSHIMRFVVPNHQHWETNKDRQEDIDPEQNVYSFWGNMPRYNSVIDSSDHDSRE